MIEEVFYNENRTYIKDTKDSEITTDNLTLDGAFDLALKTHAIFNYDTVDNLDIKYMDNYLMKCSEAPNRSIVNFFDKCEEYGINSIIGNETDTFGMIGARKVISHIIDDYKPIESTMLYNLEAYGTDNYIAKVVYDDLKAINDNIKYDTRITALIKTVEEDDYDLDEFLKLLKLLPKKSDENIIKEFKERFKKHQELSRTASAGKFKGGLADHSEKTTAYHTATHLLNAALKVILGKDVHQKGSNITPERMRFDFSCDHKLTDDEKKKVEDLVNEWIAQGLDVKCEEMKKDDAIKSGAECMFIEKYPDIVTVYSIGNDKETVSKELCGGPHVKNTSELGHFKIKKEEASSAGVRRIKAILE